MYYYLFLSSSRLSVILCAQLLLLCLEIIKIGVIVDWRTSHPCVYSIPVLKTIFTATSTASNINGVPSVVIRCWISTTMSSNFWFTNSSIRECLPRLAFISSNAVHIIREPITTVCCTSIQIRDNTFCLVLVLVLLLVRQPPSCLFST